eukprot:5562029-Prymnesium_polylepis.1
MDGDAWVAIAVMICMTAMMLCFCCNYCCRARRRLCAAIRNLLSSPAEGLSVPLNETPPAGGVSSESTEPYELPASGRLGLIFFAVERKGLREYKMWFEDGWESK